jgi:hypothetical protein
VRERVGSGLASTSSVFRTLVELGLLRLEAILRGFSSTGMDTHAPEELIRRLSLLDDWHVALEVRLVLKELMWRLKELERELTLRVQLFAPREAPLLDVLLATLKGQSAG